MGSGIAFTCLQYFFLSKILGWCLICSASFFSLLTTCYARCRSKVSYLQMSFWKTYAQKEKEQLEKVFLDYASKLSERNLKCFFENKRPDVFPMPTFAAWEAASQLHSFNQSQQGRHDYACFTDGNTRSLEG